MARRAVTLFIEDSAIKLVVTDGRHVLKWVRAPLAPGLVTGGLVADEERVAARLKEVTSLLGLKTARIIIGLNELNALYRLITLPELPDALLPEAVRREAERVVPISLDEAYLSYQALPVSKLEKRYFLAVFPRHATDVLVRTLRAAGLQPYLMDLAPLAIARPAGEPRAVIIDVRRTSFDIVVMVDNIPEVIRSLPLPSEAQSLIEKLPTITEELERTVTFYNSSHTESPLDATVPVFVSGDLADATEYWPHLVGSLGNPVSILPSPMQALEGFDPSQFMVNIGLALKPLSPEQAGTILSQVNFNALPQVYTPERLRLARVALPVGGVIGLVVIGYLGLMAQSTGANANTVRTQIAAAERNVAQENKATADVKKQLDQVQAQLKATSPQLNQVKAMAGAYENTLEELKTAREDLLGDLNEILRLLPDDASLKTISRSAGAWNIAGSASEPASVFAYVRALRNSPQFTTATLTSITTGKSTETGGTATVSFNLVLE
ncbi:MAG: PilN domain-containing protein [Chloroflexi bacterium]|nr:PilN domain-containing protein [Chloroflexota bacterium]